MIKNCKLEDLYNLEQINNTLKTTKEKKELYGEVKTPLRFAERILSIIPDQAFQNPYLKWLDPGTGTGSFSIILYFKLMTYLDEVIPNVKDRSEHIILNMIYMVEIQSANIIALKNLFGTDANIYEGDFLEYNMPNNKLSADTRQFPLQYDMIIGNPPFNCNGLKKVPTNITAKKIQDGNTIWIHFVIKSVALLKEDKGQLCIFIPSIWLKPDKKKMYNFLGQYQINYLNCISNTETNKIFSGNAQTPSCYFLLTKRPTANVMSIFDTSLNRYIDYYLTKSQPIPVFGQSIIQKLQKFCWIGEENNAINVIKTNMPGVGVDISWVRTDEYRYRNISTCHLKKDNSPDLVLNYSNKPLAFAAIPKLVLAHKMYGFPYLDLTGQYGISNRDNYIILKEEQKDLVTLQRFLSTKTALYLFEATRYRMKYLERYAFQLIPDVTKLTDFPAIINDETIADYFDLSKEEQFAIQNLHTKKYNFFV